MRGRRFGRILKDLSLIRPLIVERCYKFLLKVFYVGRGENRSDIWNLGMHHFFIAKGSEVQPGAQRIELNGTIKNETKKTRAGTAKESAVTGLLIRKLGREEFYGL